MSDDIPANNTRFKRSSGLQTGVNASSNMEPGRSNVSGLVASKKDQLLTLWCKTTPQLASVYKKDQIKKVEGNISNCTNMPGEDAFDIAMGSSEVQLKKPPKKGHISIKRNEESRNFQSEKGFGGESSDSDSELP